MDERTPAPSVEPFDDLLQEIRVLLAGSQVLTAFLMTVPFSSGFTHLNGVERNVFAATFLTVLLSLILFATPAAYHRLVWPVPDRRRFKRLSTRLVIAGLVPLSIALVLATQLVLNEVFKAAETSIGTALVAAMILVMWWLWPLAHRRGAQE